MKQQDPHIRPEDDFFKKVNIPFEKSKEDIWATMSEKLEEPTDSKVVSLFSLKRIAAAAAVLIVGLTSFMRFYTTELTIARGEHQTHQLPDGSVVSLNAESSLSYHPYWWTFSREIHFEGEAFFEVEKGQKFSVISQHGQTDVLGTSFNIYARHDQYKVFCNTGKVRVSGTTTDVEMVITPGELASVEDHQGKVKNAQAEAILSWKENKFNFSDTPIAMVIEELERQYDATIQLDSSVDQNEPYGGYFLRSSSIEESLSTICDAMNLSFEYSEKGTYTVFQND